MKKVSLLVLVAILASTLLMAAIQTSMVRLTMINKSGYDVYMKLEGSPLTAGFYYLTLPSGTRDSPTVKVFTIMTDLYTRTTWQCNGFKSTGSLVVSGNLRLTFTPCGERADRCYYYYWNYTTYTCYPIGDHQFAFEPRQWFVKHYKYFNRMGEPTMEKVTYFKYPAFYARGLGGLRLPYWSIAQLYAGFWNFGCFTWGFRILTWKTPAGCWFAYQY
jgi:hypothetical protein